MAAKGVAMLRVTGVSDATGVLDEAGKRSATGIPETGDRIAVCLQAQVDFL